MKIIIQIADPISKKDNLIKKFTPNIILNYLSNKKLI